jgi:epoxyqueuosine reductase
MPTRNTLSESELNKLPSQIRDWAQQLGFQQIGISGIDLDQDETWLLNWLDKKFHGDMGYMQRHGESVPGLASWCRVPFG